MTIFSDGLIRQHLSFRKAREGFLKKENETKAALMEMLEHEGEPDEGGHRFIYLPEPEDGVKGVKRERRVSQILDEDAALDLIKRKGLEADCLETITVISEDALLAANFDGQISDEEMKALYSEKESFALILVKDK